MAIKEYPVYGEGIRGVLLAPARFLDDSKERLVRLEDGTELRVPAEALEAQPDGSFYLRPRNSEPAAEPPPAAELPHPARTAAMLQESPIQDAAPPPHAAPPAPTPEEPLFRLGYTVRKVPVNRVLDQPVGPRQEGDTMIYPVMEEVLVVEKRLVLREEIHVTPERAPIPTHRIQEGEETRAASQSGEHS